MGRILGKTLGRSLGEVSPAVVWMAIGSLALFLIVLVVRYRRKGSLEKARAAQVALLLLGLLVILPGALLSLVE